MSESLVYEFYVSTDLVGSEITEKIDLIAEGLISSLKEWAVLSSRAQGELLEEILENFLSNNIEFGWNRA